MMRSLRCAKAASRQVPALLASVAGALAVVAPVAIDARPALAPAAPTPTAAAAAHTASPQPAESREARVWEAPSGLRQRPIWPGTAPGMDATSQPPESVLSKFTPEALHGDRSEAVFDVSTPTMTVYPARGRSTRAAIVVFPGGGFMALAITLEGTEVCEWLADRGITCVLSKYRVPRSNHHY